MARSGHSALLVLLLLLVLPGGVKGDPGAFAATPPPAPLPGAGQGGRPVVVKAPPPSPPSFAKQSADKGSAFLRSIADPVVIVPLIQVSVMVSLGRALMLFRKHFKPDAKLKQSRRLFMIQPIWIHVPKLPFHIPIPFPAPPMEILMVNLRFYWSNLAPYQFRTVLRDPEECGCKVPPRSVTGHFCLAQFFCSAFWLDALALLFLTIPKATVNLSVGVYYALWVWVACSANWERLAVLLNLRDPARPAFKPPEAGSKAGDHVSQDDPLYRLLGGGSDESQGGHGSAGGHDAPEQMLLDVEDEGGEVLPAAASWRERVFKVIVSCTFAALRAMELMLVLIIQ
jgi:hypothetical protein